MNERVLLTGSSGFLGRRMAELLREQGATVAAPGREVLDVSAGILPDVPTDWVIHLAGRTFVPASWTDPADFYRVNALGTVNVLEYCRRVRAKLIYVSGYCYGIPGALPIAETAPLKPNNPYAFSKHAAEDACRFFFESFQTPVTIVRPFNIYGPRQPSNFLIPQLVEQAIDPDTETIVVEDDTPKRDYVHLDDVVGAIACLIRNPRPGATFNVGSGVSYSVADVAEMVCRAAGVRKPLVSRGNRRVNDIPDVIADVSAIRNAVGWLPTVPLFEGLCETVAFARRPAGSNAVV